MWNLSQLNLQLVLRIIFTVLLSTFLSFGAKSQEIENSKVYTSIINMFNGSTIGTRYVLLNSKGLDAADKVQWKAKINFALALIKNDQGSPEWILRSTSGTGPTFTLTANDFIGRNGRNSIDQVGTDFNLKTLWIEYHWQQNIAQVGSLESTTPGFTSGVTSIDSSGWIKGARVIGQKMKLLGFQVERVGITAGRVEDFNNPMATDGWGQPNFYEFNVEVLPMKNLKVDLTQSVLTGFKSQDPIDYSPRIYAEYNITELFKEILNSLSVESRLHTKGNHTVQRSALTANKIFKDKPLNNWAAQISYIVGGVEDMYIPIESLYTPNSLREYQGKEIAMKIESPVLAKPFNGYAELKFYVRGIVGLNTSDSIYEDNSRFETGISLTEITPPVQKTHLFQKIEDEQKRKNKLLPQYQSIENPPSDEENHY